MPRFHITIGPRHAPRLSFEVMAQDGETAHNRAADLRLSVDERMVVEALPDIVDPLDAMHTEADLAYARGLKEREQRRVQVAHEIEVNLFRGRSWL